MVYKIEHAIEHLKSPATILKWDFPVVPYSNDMKSHKDSAYSLNDSLSTVPETPNVMCKNEIN